MTATISPEIKKQFFDINGNPLSGGKLHVYEAGTATPVDSYTTEVGDTPNTNPIVLDSRGEVGGLFLLPGAYKFLLKDSSDVDIWSQDNVTVRDLASEIDALKSDVSTVNSVISNEATPNRIVSGVKSANSSAPRFLVPIGTTNQVKIEASNENPLSYVVNSASHSILADVVASGLVSAPTTNNTALVNSSILTGQGFTKTLGEFGSVIPFDSHGSEFTSRDGELAGFKIGTEYFLAEIDIANSCLKNAIRGTLLNQSSQPIERVVISDNDTITLMRLTYLHVTSTSGVLASYRAPFFSATEPSAPNDGDMWFDFINKKWMRFNSTTFVESGSTELGISLQDESGNTVAARGVDFAGEFSNENSIELAYSDSTSIKSVKRDNRVSVYGKVLSFSSSEIVFNIVEDLETGEVEAADTNYYAYLKENGDSLLSPHAPINRIGDLKGYYHPQEAWRYIGSVANDSGSNFLQNSVQNSKESTRSKVNNLSLSENYHARGNEEVILMDSTSGVRNIILPPPSISKGSILLIQKIDTATNSVNIESDSFTHNLRLPQESIRIFSDGITWRKALSGYPKIAYVKDAKSAGTAGGDFNTGSFIIRTLNTVRGDLSIVSLDGNTMELSNAGVFRIRGRVPAYVVDNHKAILYNLTSVSNEAIGTSEITSSANAVMTWSHIDTVVVLSGLTRFDVRHRCTSQRLADGLGAPSNFGVEEVYTDLVIEQIA